MWERDSFRGWRQRQGEWIEIVKRVYVFLRDGNAGSNPKHIDIVCSHFEFNLILHSNYYEKKLIYFNPLIYYIKLQNVSDITR